MNAPVRITFLAALASMCALTCRGDIILNWLDEPMVLSAPFFSEESPLDLNEDSIIDFTFGYDFHFVGLRSEDSNQYLILPDPPPNIGGPVEPLDDGFKIGPESGDGSLDWFGTNTDFATLVSVFEGPSGPVYGGRFAGQRAYIGVEFGAADGTHYGWIDIYVASGAYAEVYGWAYETDPGVSIIAGAIPEPSTMLLFAAGSVAVLLSQLKKANR
jgi:hypothetical protein